MSNRAELYLNSVQSSTICISIRKSWHKIVSLYAAINHIRKLWEKIVKTWCDFWALLLVTCEELWLDQLYQQYVTTCHVSSQTWGQNDVTLSKANIHSWTLDSCLTFFCQQKRESKKRCTQVSFYIWFVKWKVAFWVQGKTDGWGVQKNF